MNVFRKCIRREFGKTKYLHYIELCEKEIMNHRAERQAVEEKAVYKEMYEQLSGMDSDSLKKSGERVAAALYTAFLIGKRFFSVVMFYFAANLVLLSLELDYTVTCISVALMGVCFLYKLVEFLSNKYCFMDAYLIMVYKSVIEKLVGHPVD